jgi:hypothetical protein
MGIREKEAPTRFSKDGVRTQFVNGSLYHEQKRSLSKTKGSLYEQQQNNNKETPNWNSIK